MSHPPGELISLAEFARRAGCDRKQVRRALEKGLLSKEDGDLLRASEVDGGWRRPNRRTMEQGGGTTACAGGGTTETVPPPGTTRRRSRATVPPPEETAAQAAERIVATQPLLTTPEAVQLKENYLARHQQLTYDMKLGTVVLIGDVSKAVGTEYATVRKKVLAIPAEQAPALFRCKTVVEVQELLLTVVSEALEALTLDQPPPG